MAKNNNTPFITCDNLLEYISKDRICDYAAENGRIDFLYVAHENKCPWSRNTTRLAAKNGYIECLVYLIHNGCPVDGLAVEEAAAGGHTNCMTFAFESCHQSGWNTCKLAAAGGHLDTLRQAHKLGCHHWDASVYEAALQNGHINCAIYAHSEKCPMNEVVRATLLDIGITLLTMAKSV